MTESATSTNAALHINTASAGTQEHLHVTEDVIKQLGALTVAAAGVQSIGDTHHLVLPPGYDRHDLTAAIEKAAPTPRRKTGTVHLGDLPSFIHFVQEQAHPSNCYIYADPEARTLTAVLNEHAPEDTSEPGWRDFRAVFRAELSREFDTWFAHNKKPKEQEEFAVFLEDNIADVHGGDDLLNVALTLQAKTEVNFSSHRRLDNGQVQLSYTETIDARAGAGALEIPREFDLGLRLFKNGDGYKLRARLKYRLGGGKVKFWYELDRPENAIEDAFKGYVAQASQTGFAVLIGKP